METLDWFLYESWWGMIILASLIPIILVTGILAIVFIIVYLKRKSRD